MNTSHNQGATMNNPHTIAVETDTELAKWYAIEVTNRERAMDEASRQHRDNGRWFNQERLDGYIAKIAEARAGAKPFEAVYDANPWSRFFLVTNNGGHIHSTMACTTCYVSTQFAWLPSVSGLTEAEAVAEYGEILCSVCFPSAPVEWTNGVAKAVQAERDERAAAKAERHAKKVAKALFPEDIERFVRVEHERIGTIAAAKSWLTNAAEWDAIYVGRGQAGEHHPSYMPADVQAVATVLADRLDTTVAQVLADAAKRAAKRK